MSNEKEIKQYEKMILTPSGRLIVSLAVPTIISMLISMIYNLADSYFVGKLGTSASAAVGIVFSVQAVFQAIGFMFGHGSGTVISRKLSECKENEADKCLTTAFLSAIAFGAILMLIGLAFVTPFMRLLGSTETILPYSRKYAYYILISGPALAASCVLNNVMRYEGKAFFAMIGLVSGGVLNMIGDPILMFGFDMGIDGAGLSTAISQYVSLFILIFMFVSGKTISKVRLRSFSFEEIKHIIPNGMPSLLRQILNSVATMTLNRCSMPYGDAAIAAMTIAGRVMMFIVSVLMGTGQGFQPVSAFNYGAKKYKRVKKSFIFTWCLGTVLMLVSGTAGFVFAKQIIAIFRNDSEVIKYGIPALRFMCIGTLFAPIGMISNMMFQSIGKSKTASFLAFMRNGIFYIPVLAILPIFIGFRGIQSAQMISDIITACASLPFTLKFFRELPHADMMTELDDRYYKAKAA